MKPNTHNPVLTCNVDLSPEQITELKRLFAESPPMRLEIIPMSCQGSIDAETLARELHEAGRAAVEAGATVAAEKFGEQTRKFLEWDEITEIARDGRRIQAEYLLHKFYIAPRES